MDDAAAPYLPDQPSVAAPSAVGTAPVFAPKPVTMAQLLAETAPIPKRSRRRLGLNRLAVMLRRGRLTPVR